MRFDSDRRLSPLARNMLRGCIQRPSLLAEKHLVFESAGFVRWHGGLWPIPTDERYCLPHHAGVTRDAAMPEALGRHEPRLGPRRGDRGAVLPADRFITLVVDYEQGRAARHVSGNVAHIQLSPAIPNAALTAGAHEVYGLRPQREGAHQWRDPRRRIGSGGEKDESLSVESPRQRERC